MNDKKQIFRTLRKEYGGGLMLAAILLTAAALMFAAVSEFGIFDKAAHLRSLYSDTPDALCGKMVCADIDTFVTPYMYFGVEDDIEHSEYIEYIIECGNGLYCGVRLAGEKALKVYASFGNGSYGTLDEPITVQGRMIKMDSDSENFYADTVGDMTYTDILPDEFRTYCILDESNSSLTDVQVYLLTALSALCIAAALILVVRYIDCSFCPEISEYISGSSDPDAAAADIADFLQSSISFFGVRSDGRFVMFRAGRSVRFIPSAEISEVRVETDGTASVCCDGKIITVRAPKQYSEGICKYIRSRSSGAD